MKRAFSRKNLWEQLPPAFRSVIGQALRVVPLPRLLGKQFRQTRAFLAGSEFWSVDQNRNYQLTQVRRICRLAYEKTAFYRRHFEQAGFHPDNIKSLDDLHHLPTIDKGTVNAHLSELCAVPLSSREVDFGSTGGTSGVPLNFYLPAHRSGIEYAYLTAGWARAGYTLGDSLAVFRGRIVHPDRTGLRHIHDPLLNCHYYSAFHLTDENMARYLDHVVRLGPCFLHVYPSSADALARFLRRTDRPPPSNVSGILAESENVYPEQRKMIEDAFRSRTFASYGHSEKLVLATECEYSRDYHVWPTYGYFELIDESGKPVTTPGITGEIVGTGFINHVVPFIRYRTGDYATLVADRCSDCGRNHPLLRDIRGHNVQEVLITADRLQIPWSAMNMHDETFLRVRQFQFYQDTPGKAVLRIIPSESFISSEADRIIQNFDRKFQGRISITIELTDRIDLSPRGKAVFVDQHIPQENLPCNP